MEPLVYTHSGDFHVDEMVAIGLLQAFAFPGRFLDVVRTRDPKKLAEAQANPEIFVIDVGREHDGGRLNFDHHQASMTDGWEDGTPYSSCGLIWQWLKGRGLLNDLAAEERAIIERDLIRPIDTHDNGGVKWPQAAVFRLYNRTGASEADMNTQFHKALEMAKDLVTNQVHQARVDYRAEVGLRKAWDESQELYDHGIVVVRDHLENRSSASILAKVSDGQASLMLYPQSLSRNNKAWFVRALAPAPNSHELRFPLPTEWRGLEDHTLMLGETPVAIKFVHKSGFLAKVEGTLEDALTLATAALEHPENVLTAMPMLAKPRKRFPR